MAIAIGVFLVILLSLSFSKGQVNFSSKAYADQQRLVSIFVGDNKKFVITSATKVEDVLKQANISVEKGDVVEPSLDAAINHPMFNVNIHRALPATINDNGKKINILTGHHSPLKIAEAAGITVYPEDKVKFDISTKPSADNGASRNVVITRAKLIHVVIDGNTRDYRTQTALIADFLLEKNIKPGENQQLKNNPNDAVTNDTQITIETQQPLPQAPVYTGAYPAGSNQKLYRASGDAWQSLRFCEAGGDYSRNSGNGFFGAYQFNLSTWGNYGGYRYPHEAPPDVQDAKARETQARRGWNPWPACSRRLGL
ncbi:MAG: transglycosylase family protein [bacterium]|nr:transglycosylase family protein [bacterium]